MLITDFEENPKKYLENEGYIQIREIDGKWYGILRMLFTWGVFCELNHIGHEGGRICFPDFTTASGFLKDWDGKRSPTYNDHATADKRRKKNRE